MKKVRRARGPVYAPSGSPAKKMTHVWICLWSNWKSKVEQIIIDSCVDRIFVGNVFPTPVFVHYII